MPQIQQFVQNLFPRGVVAVLEEESTHTEQQEREYPPNCSRPYSTILMAIPRKFSNFWKHFTENPFWFHMNKNPTMTMNLTTTSNGHSKQTWFPNYSARPSSLLSPVSPNLSNQSSAWPVFLATTLTKLSRKPSSSTPPLIPFTSSNPNTLLQWKELRMTSHNPFSKIKIKSFYHRYVVVGNQ